ncbi:MAG: sulfatase [bacterium]
MKKSHKLVGRLLLLYVTVTAVKPFTVFALSRPNIVLIVIDTLRADHVSAYGYSRKTTPFIDSLAAGGTLYTRAYAPSSWTIPSVASLFTGYYPFNHGVNHRLSRSERLVSYNAIPQKFVTLAERFKQAGYKTMGISSTALLNKEHGYAQGFDYFSCEDYVDAEETNRMFEKTMGRIKGKVSPFFLWVHYFDPHLNYKLRKPWINRYFPLAKYLLIDEITFKTQCIVNDPKFSIAGYDSEINYVDKYIGKFLKNIPQKNTIVVITSDHGEEFQDHGHWGHSINLYNEAVHIPLIISDLSTPAGLKRENRPVSLLDLYPTLLSLARIPVPGGLDARSLLPGDALPGKDRPQRVIFGEIRKRSYIIESNLEIDTQFTIIRGNYKLYRHTAPNRETLYNLHEDPGETKDMSMEKPEIKKEMHAIMEDWFKKQKRGPIYPSSKVPFKLNGKLLKELKAFGYIQ